MPAHNSHIELIQQVLWLIPVLPLAGFLFIGLLGSRLPEKANGWIASLMVFGSLLLSLFSFKHLLAIEAGHRLVEVDLFNWVTIGAKFTINFSLQI